jgi:hypothetical protein
LIEITLKTKGKRKEIHKTGIKLDRDYPKKQIEKEKSLTNRNKI